MMLNQWCHYAWYNPVHQWYHPMALPLSNSLEPHPLTMGWDWLFKPTWCFWASCPLQHLQCHTFKGYHWGNLLSSTTTLHLAMLNLSVWHFQYLKKKLWVDRADLDLPWGERCGALALSRMLLHRSIFSFHSS